MDDTQTPAKVAKVAEPVISAEEAERHRTHARVAIAENRIEGIQPHIATKRFSMPMFAERLKLVISLQPTKTGRSHVNCAGPIFGMQFLNYATPFFVIIVPT